MTTKGTENHLNINDLFWAESAIVRGLRGKKSQGAIKRRLGSNFNWIAKVEQGKRRIKWSEFVRLIELNSISSEQKNELRDREISRLLLAIRKKASDEKVVEVVSMNMPAHFFAYVDQWNSNRVDKLRQGKVALLFVDVLAMLARNQASLFGFLRLFISDAVLDKRFSGRSLFVNEMQESTIHSIEYFLIASLCNGILWNGKVAGNEREVRNKFEKMASRLPVKGRTWDEIIDSFEKTGVLKRTDGILIFNVRQTKYSLGIEGVRTLMNYCMNQSITQYSHPNSNKSETAWIQALPVTATTRKQIMKKVKQLKVEVRELTSNSKTSPDSIIYLGGFLFRSDLID